MKQTTADKNITNSAERKVIVMGTGDKGLGTLVTSKSLVPSPYSYLRALMGDMVAAVSAG